MLRLTPDEMWNSIHIYTENQHNYESLALVDNANDFGKFDIKITTNGQLSEYYRHLLDILCTRISIVMQYFYTTIEKNEKMAWNK